MMAWLEAEELERWRTVTSQPCARSAHLYVCDRKVEKPIVPVDRTDR
jgi:hypothetical protein